MQTSDVRAYEGKEPFIFISYAHKDSARVLPILSQLQRRSYRVWYDEGIAPGSEWPENIAQHLNDCAVTVAFVSNNSMASPNCRREITYALSKKKPFLGIFLEQTEMSPGMELQMSAQQCVMKFSYRSEEMFYDKVCSCPDLDPCKRTESAPAVVPPVAPATKAETPAAPAKANLLKQKPWLLAVAGGALAAIILAIVLIAGSGNPADPSGTGNKNLGVNTTGSTSGTVQTPSTTIKPAETEPSQTTQPEQTDPTEPIESTEPTESTEPIDPTDPTEPEDDDSTTITLYPDKVVDRETDYLYLYGKTITADTIRKINKLESLETLELKECTFDTGVLDNLGGGDRIHYLYLTSCSGITDYTFLDNFPQLWELSLNDCGVTDANFPQLTTCEIETLDLSNNSEFTDLSKLSQLTLMYNLSIAGTGATNLNGFPIEQLFAIDFSYTTINDISRLANCEGLSKVYGIKTSVNSIAPLAKLENLSVLAFSGSFLNKITTPFYSLYLRELHLSDCGLSDISGLTHLTQLEVVDLSKNSLSDVSFVRESCDTLRELKINNVPLTSGTDFSFLSECEYLEVLHVDYIALHNLDFCSTLTSLVELHASNCSLTDISGLENCTSLKYIHLPKNQITDISALAYLGEDYITLDLAYNQLTDVSALSDVTYTTLCLVENSQLDLSTVTVNGNTLLINYVLDLETKLADNFYYYGILSCPLNKILLVKETYGDYNVTFLENNEDFLAMAAEHNLYYH